MPIAKRKPKPEGYAVWKSYRGQSRYVHNYHTQKRLAIRYARRLAKAGRGPWPRQVSVYAENGTKNGSLVYQVHYSPKLRRLIAEEL